MRSRSKQMLTLPCSPPLESEITVILLCNPTACRSRFAHRPRSRIGACEPCWMLFEFLPDSSSRRFSRMRIDCSAMAVSISKDSVAKVFWLTWRKADLGRSGVRKAHVPTLFANVSLAKRLTRLGVHTPLGLGRSKTCGCSIQVCVIHDRGFVASRERLGSVRSPSCSALFQS